MMLQHFKLSEFDSPDLPGSGSLMDKEFLRKIDLARDLAEIPFVITSGYRTPSHNRQINGSPTSSHLKGFAADIACHDSITRQKIINVLIIVGFKRIGIAKTFIHADTDTSKPDAIWLYD